LFLKVIEKHEQKRNFLIFFSAVCISFIVASLFYWYVEQMTEQKFQFYVEKLESKGITVEEKSLQGFHDQEIHTSIFWNDFGMEIESYK
jgi:hypothetical protein